MSVACLQQLADKTILSRGAHEGERLGEERIREIERGVQETVAELFRAAIGAGSSFQVSAPPPSLCVISPSSGSCEGHESREYCSN